MTRVFLAKLPSYECHWTLLIIYLSQSWHSFMPPYGTIRPHRLNQVFRRDNWSLYFSAESILGWDTLLLNRAWMIHFCKRGHVQTQRYKECVDILGQSWEVTSTHMFRHVLQRWHTSEWHGESEPFEISPPKRNNDIFRVDSSYYQSIPSYILFRSPFCYFSMFLLTGSVLLKIIRRSGHEYVVTYIIL